MSDFSISSFQRRRLLEAGNDPDATYGPLDFDIKPFGCKPGAKYVLDERPARKVLIMDRDDNFLDVVEVPAMDVWYLVVTSVVRHRKGFWRVQFDVVDLRDPTIYLRAGAGYTTSRRDAVDPLPVVVSDEVRQKTVEEIWHQRRLARFAEQQRARSRARRQRRAA